MRFNVHAFDDVNDANELIGLAIGAGSVCWENPAGAGVFDSCMAAAVADAAYQRLLILLRDNWLKTMTDDEVAFTEENLPTLHKLRDLLGIGATNEVQRPRF